MFWKSAMPVCYSSSSPADAGRGFNIFDSTNLDRLLDSFTPCLPLHLVPRSRIYEADANWLPVGDEPIPYFSLADLWQGFDQASVYGIGSRVLFDDGDIVTQYYSPFLSAIQLYTNRPYASASAEIVRCDSYIPWSNDSESESISKSLSYSSSPTWEAYSKGSVENSWYMPNDKRGYPYLNYCEFASPFWRVPFYDKMMDLTLTRPELMTLSSIELSPWSWLAVVWYPIYNIPCQTRSKDLSTVFLTYYTLSPISLGDYSITESNEKGKTTRKKFEHVKTKEAKNDMICLQPFGLSTFKLSGNTWTKNESDIKKISTLHCAADSWLKQLNFFHHDFIFYLTQPPYDQHK